MIKGSKGIIALNTKFDLVSQGENYAAIHTRNVRSIPHLPIYCDRYEDYRQFSPRHWHDHIEIIYVVSGSLQVVCGENEYTLQEMNFCHKLK